MNDCGMKRGLIGIAGKEWNRVQVLIGLVTDQPTNSCRAVPCGMKENEIKKKKQLKKSLPHPFALCNWDCCDWPEWGVGPYWKWPPLQGPERTCRLKRSPLTASALPALHYSIGAFTQKKKSRKRRRKDEKRVESILKIERRTFSSRISLRNLVI